MFNVFKKLSLFVFVIVFISGCFFSVSARPAGAETAVGFIEFQTQASINFQEQIEVVLTNKETGEEFSYRLLRANDYNGNLAVPFGVYTVSTELLQATESNTICNIVCSVTEIDVKNPYNATLVSIRVDEFTSVDVSDPEVPLDEMETLSTDPFISDKSDTVLSESETPSTEDIIAQPHTQGETEKPERSIWVSLSIFVFLIGVVAAVLFYIKKRNE